MKFKSPLCCGLLLLLAVLCPNGLHAQTNDNAWSVAVLDQILAEVQPDQRLVLVADMEIPVKTLKAWRDKLAGVPTTQLATDVGVNLWTGGNVYYTFTNTLTADKQRAFTNAALEWTLFANVHFIPRTAQVNYVVVSENGSLNGGQASLGMVGGAQSIQIGPTAWTRGVVSHEIGHCLGLVHEHQRSDRDSFLTVNLGNVSPGQTANFTKLTTSLNQGAYDFLSIMHYTHNAFSVDPNTLDTMVPLPAYSQYYSIMGNGNPVLSVLDRSGIAQLYGAATVPITSVVTNTQDNGLGSLRAAMYYGFDHPGTTITFNIATNDPGYTNGVFTIQPVDQLPGPFNATVIDAATEPVQLNPGGPAIQLNGALMPSPTFFVNGLRFAGANCGARGLIINGFNASGVLFTGSNSVGNVLRGCYVGINAAGTAGMPNGQYGVNVANGASGNIIGGTNAADRNVISGSSTYGLILSGTGIRSNVVLGNYIGLNGAGTSALPNSYAGVLINGGVQSNTIGGTVPGARNVISGNANQGIVVADPGTIGNVIAGNYIGLDATGTTAVPNSYAGVDIGSGAQNNILGPGNVISGNLNQGALVADTGTTGNIILGNYIGLNAAGTSAVPNVFNGFGFYAGAQGNTLGGPQAWMRNVLSGNQIQGVLLNGAGVSGNVVAGNYIGLNATGTAAVPNQSPGIQILGGASGNLIGGGPGMRNVISGNAVYGIAISGSGSDANVVQGNTVGLNAANNAAVPNANVGIVVFSGAQSNQIGGITPGTANLVASNASVGIVISDPAGTNNSVRGNSIFGNASGSTGNGISLNGSGNHLQVAPVLSSATVGTATTIIGSLTSAASTVFHLDFFASPPPATAAQARLWLGTMDVTTSGGGTVTFTNIATTVPLGQIIRATATDPAGNTSALSTAAIAAGGTSTVADGIPDAWRAAKFGGGGTTTNSTSCATCDPDGDGMNNRAEFLAGTNPTNAASVLRAGPVAKAGTNITLNFPSVAGVVYRVESRDDVATGSWSILADQIIGPGGTVPVVDPGAASQPRRFYRITVFP